MMSSKWGYLCTHIIEKVEGDKMSANRDDYSDEEERMVVRVGGRVRGLLQAIRRIQRERAGRTLPNLGEAPDGLTRTHRQEVGTPCGRAGTQDRRLGGLQAWGIRNNAHRTCDNT